MKDKIFILCCLCLTLLMASCNKCGDCLTGPPSFSLELIDKETGENVFASGKYTAEDIVLKDENQKTVYTKFIAGDNLNIIRIALPDIEGDKELKMELGGTQVIVIRLHVRKGGSKCCINYFTENITVEDFAYGQSKETDAIRIKI